MAFNRSAVRDGATRLASQGVYLGTSSWKYEGWLGQLYSAQRYEYRGRTAKTRFDRDCLTEYSEVFKTVCVDAAYYTFPSTRYLQALANQVPHDFLFAFKVTDTITIRNYPKLDRFGDLAGKPNDNFLNADLFANSFLTPCESIRSQVGLLIFEFSRFWPADYAQGRDFIAHLQHFLSQLPTGWPYGIEIRNRNWLVPDYFACLAQHQVTHVFNSWEAMPPVPEQMALAHSRTNPSQIAARFLLRPGRKYEDAVRRFQPYDQTREVNPEARQAAADLVREGTLTPERRTFIYVNNRLEGNALSTIEAIISASSNPAP